MRLALGLGAVVLLTAVSSAALADEYTRGYERSNGTYVQPSYRSSPDGNSYNNYSTKGNENPYTGQEGTRNPGYDEGEGGSSVYNENPHSNDGLNSGY